MNNVTGVNIHRDTLDDGRVRYSVWSEDSSDSLNNPGMEMGVDPRSLLPKCLKTFDTEQEAIDYARKHNIDTTIVECRFSTNAGKMTGAHFNCSIPNR